MMVNNMNREIKFRVWDATEKEYNYDIVAGNILSAIHGSGDPLSEEEEEQFTLQQYTGCKDKNGTPIYEGDILVADHDGGEGEANVGVVYFAAGTFMIDGDGPFFDHVFGHSPDILDNHTVIGNKFENPELLKA
jgi:uncharacterized phage protein (TIGR01671 family)